MYTRKQNKTTLNVVFIMHWMLYLIPECCFPGGLKQNHLASNISIYIVYDIANFRHGSYPGSELHLKINPA